MKKYLYLITAIALISSACSSKKSNDSATPTPEAMTETEVVELEETAIKAEAATTEIEESSEALDSLLNDLEN